MSAPPLFYKSSLLYDLLMQFLYGRYLEERGEALAKQIDRGCSVLDICCGTGELFRKHLRQKNIEYQGVDLNPVFIRRLQAKGVSAICADARAFPVKARSFDYVILQGSLSEFSSAERTPLLQRLHQGARRGFLLSESIRHLIYHQTSWIAKFATRIGRPLQSSPEEPFQRLQKADLEDLMRPFNPYVRSMQVICGGRTMLYVLRPVGDQAVYKV
jgi:SAM-dependent methyltransferase